MTPQTRVKERAEEQSSAMSTDQQAMIRMLANDLHRLNHSIMKAVDAGVSVELVRSARHHGGEVQLLPSSSGARFCLKLPVHLDTNRHQPLTEPPAERP